MFCDYTEHFRQDVIQSCNLLVDIVDQIVINHVLQCHGFANPPPVLSIGSVPKAMYAENLTI